MQRNVRWDGHRVDVSSPLSALGNSNVILRHLSSPHSSHHLRAHGPSITLLTRRNKAAPPMILPNLCTR